MTAYEIQLRYVIRDKIQSETNSARDKIREFFFYRKNNFVRKKLADFVRQIDAYHH